MKNNIRFYRQKRGITQEQFGDALGVTRQTIIAIESGKYLPSLPLVFRMAAFFQEPIEVLFIDDEKEDNK